MAKAKPATAKDTIVVGAHCSGGAKGCVASAHKIGAQAIQIFLGSPQSWKEPTLATTDLTNLAKTVKQDKLGPLFVHGNYLVNLASASKENLTKSVGNLALSLRLADTAGAQGLVFHPGSAGQATYQDALARVVDSVETVLSGYKGSCRLLLEVCAGQGQTIGCNFQQFADILKALDYDERIGVCWDTCHLFNAGYDVSSDKGLEATVAEFDALVGFQWLFAIHANDSKTPLGARRDRHENIGMGHIGRAGFSRMLHHPRLRHLPWILEVPGFENKGPDRQNIETMHELAN